MYNKTPRSCGHKPQGIRWSWLNSFERHFARHIAIRSFKVVQMGVLTCPLPDVAEALSPFIRPKDEVARIRQELQACLQTHIATDNTPLTVANLSTITTSSSSHPPPAISGVRRAYWRALQAHNVAQARYDALKSDVFHLQSPTAPGTEPTLQVVTEGYIPLLRQRERQRRLTILERAVSAISVTGKDVSTTTLDDFFKYRIGDPPSPPSTSASVVFDETPDVEARVLRLKKAVLSAKRGLDGHSQMCVANDGPATISAEAEISGLQRALSVLTGWMENQLTIIGHAEAQAPDIPKTPGRGVVETPQLPSQEAIEGSYEEYLAARRRLIDSLHQPSIVESELSALPITIANENSGELPINKPTASEIVLPHIPRLAFDKREEAAQLQQSSFLRRQIATAEAETERLVARLADESHLVHPGASSGKHWADAAAEADRATRENVRQRVQAGEAAAQSARETLANIEGVPKILGRIVVD